VTALKQAENASATAEAAKNQAAADIERAETNIVEVGF